MRKMMFAAASFVALAGAAGAALAQDGPGPGQAPQGPMSRLWQGDANNDGVLTRQEFTAAHTSQFAQADADHNGQISRDEMRQMHAEHRGEHGERGDHHRGGHHGGNERWAGADANNDGSITREEFLARPAAAFDRLDANHDGVISGAERPARGDGPRGERGDHRAEFDANNDQQISRAEWTAMGDRMFQHLDSNNDGRITREEAAAGGPPHGARH